MREINNTRFQINFTQPI